MAEIQLFKTKITLACKLIRSSDKLDQPFAFPPQKDECEVYIRERTAQLNHLMTTIKKAKEHHDTYVEKAIEAISLRSEQKEREKLMLDLNNHLELESNCLEIETLQWMCKIDFRKEELAQQASLITEATSVTNQAVSNQSNSLSGADTANSYERSVRVRRPLLEVPTFSGNFREFNTFWSVFESLIHNDADLSDQEKFLFLKQAVKGKAAASISSIPVIGDKYNAAVSILKKQYDRSSSIADILINEIEHLPRAQGSSTSCRNTLSAISSRIVHLEQARVLMSADRVWRRLILSKFTESICSQETFISNEVKITLKALRSYKRLQNLPVFTLERLTSSTKTAHLSDADRSFIKREKITIAQHSLKSPKATPALYQVICYDNPAMVLPSGLILTPTIFGYTISGKSRIQRALVKGGLVCSSHFVAMPSAAIAHKLKEKSNLEAHFGPV
ncbi:hypothetical protein COOONC_05012 [Cooperia oncophora]